MFDLATVNFSKDTPMKALIDHSTSVLSEHLRDYQLEATLYTISASTKNLNPLLLEVPTGGGKSWICVSIAYIMSLLFKRAGYENRRTLIICPTDTLVEQNAEKLRRAGGDVAIFCASLKLKQTEGTIIVGTPVSIFNAIELFSSLNIGCVIVDEAHVHADTSKAVVAALRIQNPRLREIGMTATPYRTVEKYIYRVNSYDNLKPNPPSLAVDPYYDELVYRVEGERLVQSGHLVPMLIQPIGLHYDTSLLKLGSGGKFTLESEREVFITRAINEAIVGDMLISTKKRKVIMVFCQNIEHAEMVFEVVNDHLSKNGSLGTAVLYHSKIDKEVSRERLSAFNEGQHRILISVRGLTTGYDNERVDGIVVLSTTESPSLFVQIMGRGMRPIMTDRRFKKTHCGLYDYGENLQRHFPEGDLFKPFIKPISKVKGKTTFLQFTCPCCGHGGQAASSAWYQPMTESGYRVNKQGYFVTPEGDELVCDVSARSVSAHIQAKCFGLIEQEDGSETPCQHTWEGQLCHECGVLNANHHEQCQYCHSDFKDRQQQEREGRQYLLKIKIPEPFKGSAVYQPIHSKITDYSVSFDTKVDKRQERYVRGILCMTLEVEAGLVFNKGKVTFQKARTETVRVYFDEHYDYAKPSKQKKKMLMKAIWGEEISMIEAKIRPCRRQLKHLEYYWAKSNKGLRYIEVLKIKSEPPKQIRYTITENSEDGDFN